MLKNRYQCNNLKWKEASRRNRECLLINFCPILYHFWLFPAQLKLLESLFSSEILVVSLFACVVFHTAGAVAKMWCIDATSAASTSVYVRGRRGLKSRPVDELKKGCAGSLFVDEKAHSPSWSYDSQCKEKTRTWNHVDWSKSFSRIKLAVYAANFLWSHFIMCSDPKVKQQCSVIKCLPRQSVHVFFSAPLFPIWVGSCFPCLLHHKMLPESS